MAKIRAPRLRGLFSKADKPAGKHRKTDAKPKYDPSDERVKADLRPARLRTPKANGNARAEIERRADTRPQRPYGQRVTPLNDRPNPYGTRTRTWPAPKPPVSTRAQLAKRGGEIRPHPDSAAGARNLRTAPKHAVSTRAQLAARGGDIRPHPDSGEGARSHVKAKGSARRPAAPLAGNPDPAQPKRNRKQTARVTPPPIPEQRRYPASHGNTTGVHGFFAPPRVGRGLGDNWTPRRSEDPR